MKIDLSTYTMIVISSSGGKDSLCTMMETVREAHRQKVGHRVICVNCDTGADWPDAEEVVKAQCSALSIPLYVVRPNISIPDYIDIDESIQDLTGSCSFEPNSTKGLKPQVSYITSFRTTMHNEGVVPARRRA